MRALGFAAIRGEAGVRFRERRFARGVAVDLALRAGVFFTRGIDVAAGGAQGFARGGFGGGGGLQFGFGGLKRLTLAGRIDAGLLKLGLDVDQPRAFGEPPRRTGGRMRRRDKTVPAPDVAFARHQPLAGLQLRHQLRAALLGHDADLRQTARQFGGGLDMGGERFDAFGQRGIAFGDAGIGPAHRRRRIDRRIEIVAQRCAERFLITFGDVDAVDDRRPQVLGLAIDDLGNRPRFGLQPLHALVGFGQRRAGGFQLLPGGDMGGLGILRGGFGLRERLLRGLHGAGERVEVAEPAGLLRQFLDFALDVRDFLIEPRQAIAMGAHAGFKLVAPGGEVGQRRGEFGEQPLGGGQRRLGFRDALIDAAALLDARLDFLFQFRVFGIEPMQRHVGIGGLLLLARDVGRKLRQPAVEFGDALFGALFLAVEHLAGIGEPREPGRGADLGLAQRRQFRGADRLDAGGFGLLAGALGEFTDVEVVGVAGLGHVGICFQPAQVKQHGLGLAHLGRDFAVADRLPRLLLQALDLSGQLPDHILDAGEVGFRGLEAQFGLVAAGMKPGDAGGVFQHAAALLRLGLNDLADLALMHQRRRTRAGGGIGKQDLHVARPHVAAVDAIDGTGLALDPARDFQRLGIVHRGGRRAIRIVDRHHHFGVVARRPVAGAGENHRVHVGRAQRFVRGFAHRPAQRLDQIGLAAAVRPDHAGQARLDHEVGGFDERFKSVQAKAREFHKSDALLAGRESLSRHNTIDGVVMLAETRGPRLLRRDNGEAGAGGQPAGRGFSRVFCGGYADVCVDASLRRPGGRRAHNRRRHRRDSCVPQVLETRRASRDGEYGSPGSTGRVVMNQLFSSGLISLSKSSNVAAPLTISPLMKKVGVELTFSTSLAYF